MSTRSLALGLLLLHCALASAQDSPEAVYANLHRAALAGNLYEMMQYATEARKREIGAQPAAGDVAKLISAMMPRSYNVTGTTISPDGATAQLRALGTGAFLGQTQQLHGTVNFLKENGAWKVDRWEWSDQPGAAPTRVQAKPAADPMPARPQLASPPPPTPAGVSRSAQPECQIKPVMTDEDLRRCGASPR